MMPPAISHDAYPVSVDFDVIIRSAVDNLGCVNHIGVYSFDLDHAAAAIQDTA